MAIITPWIECDMCEDFICTVHANLHAADCECPPVEYWVEFGLDPYDKCRAEAVNVMLEETKGWEDADG